MTLGSSTLPTRRTERRGRCFEIPWQRTTRDLNNAITVSSALRTSAEELLGLAPPVSCNASSSPPRRDLVVVNGFLPSSDHRNRKPGQALGNARQVALKVALDRLVFTPPYLAVTLFALRMLQGWGLDRSARETRALYRGLLITNWKASVDREYFFVHGCSATMFDEERNQI